MEPAAFDYVDGGAWDEVSLAENDAAWLRYRLRPRVLVDVTRIDTSTTLLGAPVAFPVAIAPMALHGLASPDGEPATARAAAGGRRPVHALDDVDSVDRGGRRGCTGRRALVPALHPGRSGEKPGPRRAGGRGRLLGDRPHRRPAGPRLPPARSPQRVRHQRRRDGQLRCGRDRADPQGPGADPRRGTTSRRSGAGRACRSCSRAS